MKKKTRLDPRDLEGFEIQELDDGNLASVRGNAEETNWYKCVNPWDCRDEDNWYGCTNTRVCVIQPTL